MGSRTLDIAFKRLRRKRSYNVQLAYQNSARGARPRRCDLPDDLWDLSLPPDAGRTTRRAPTAPLIGPPNRGADVETLKATGRRLFDRVVGTKGEGVFHAQLASAVEHPDGRLRIRIDVGDDPSLFQVPWEMLYDDQQAWLATDVRTPVIRVLQSNKIVAPPRPAAPPLKMLVVIANPQSDLDVFGEVTDIEKRIQAVRSTPEDLVSIVDVLRTATLTELSTALAVHRPHILHYIGHGGFDEEGGFLHLHDEADLRRSTPISAELMGQMIQSDPPQLAVLNTCQGATAATSNPFGGVAQSLIRQGVPTVVAMQFPISDEAAILFSTTLYGALGRGEPVDVAVNRGRHAIMLRKPIAHELVTPVLYSADLASGHLIISLPAAPSVPSGAPSPTPEAAPVARVGAPPPYLRAPRPGMVGLATAASVGLAILLLSVWASPMSKRAEMEGSSMGDVSIYPGAGPFPGATGSGPGDAGSLPPMDAVEADPSLYPPLPRDPGARSHRPRPVRQVHVPSAPVAPPPISSYPIVVPELEPVFAAPLPTYAQLALPVGPETEAGSALDAVSETYFRSGAEIRLANRSRDPLAAQRIRDWLQGRGVPESAIVIQGWGESPHLSPWLQGSVDLTFGPPAVEPPATTALRFHAGTVELAPEGQPGLLETFAAYQASHNLDLSVRLIGRTDETAPPQDAAALAYARATSIAAWLGKHGMAADRIAITVDPASVSVSDGVAVGVSTESFLTGAEAVYFDLASASPGADEAAKLDQVSRWLQANPGAAIALKGYASVSGPRALNRELSDRRARAVSDSLIERGVSDDAIVSVFAGGESGTIEDPAARRVDLVIVPRH